MRKTLAISSNVVLSYSREKEHQSQVRGEEEEEIHYFFAAQKGPKRNKKKGKGGGELRN